ncbi:hypothetical protein ACFL18_02185 [Patescibacteria group bacterium]
MKRIIKYWPKLLLLLLVVFCLYLLDLRLLALQNNKIFALRCTTINPLLISYKTSFLEFTDYLKNPDEYSEEEIKEFLDGYMNGMRKYEPEETKWLEAQNKHINRWDFKLFTPWYVKKAAHYQWKMYEAYRDDAKYMVEVMDNGSLNVDLDVKLDNSKSRRAVYEQAYIDFFKQAGNIKDWRGRIISLPLPEACTAETLTIPNTAGSIDWQDKPSTTAPGVFIDNPNRAS